MEQIQLLALQNFPLIEPGDHLDSIIFDSILKNHIDIFLKKEKLMLNRQKLLQLNILKKKDGKKGRFYLLNVGNMSDI